MTKLIRSEGDVDKLLLEEFYQLAWITKSSFTISLVNDKVVKVRNQLVDWLFAVSEKLKLLPKTYMLSVHILDNALEILDLHESIETNVIHLVAISCIIIATKFEEINYIGFETAEKCLGKNRFSREQLKEAEMTILKVLKFSINPCVFPDIIRTILSILDIKREVKSKGSLPCLSRSFLRKEAECNFYYKVALQNYDFYRFLEGLALIFGILYFSLNHKFLQTDGFEDSEYDNNSDLFEIGSLCNVNSQQITAVSDQFSQLLLEFLKFQFSRQNHLFNGEYLALCSLV